MKNLTFTLLAAALLAALPTHAHAVFTFTLAETAGAVTIVGSGSLNITGLTSPGDVSGGAAITPSSGILFAGAGTLGPRYAFTSNPAVFGIGSTTVPTSSTGDRVGVFSDATVLALPTGYVSGSALSNLSTYNGATFSSLRFTPGTYTYTLATGDSLVVTSVVPEPGAWAMMGVGTCGLGLALRRQRRGAAARA